MLIPDFHPQLLNPDWQSRLHIQKSPRQSLLPNSTELLLLLLLSRFSSVRLCVTPKMAAYQASPSLGVSRQEHGSGLPFPSSTHESEKWKWSRSVVPDSSDPMDCSLPGSSVHGIFQAKVLEWGATAFSNSTETPSQTCGCEALPRMVPSTQGPGHWVMGWWDLSGDDRPWGKFPGECACTGVRKDTSESQMISKSKEGHFRKDRLRINWEYDFTWERGIPVAFPFFLFPASSSDNVSF